MKTNRSTHLKARGIRQAAFSLIELCVAMSIILVTFLTIFASLTMGLSITQLSRENLRATQIMLDKMEGVRLYNWDQLTNSAVLVPMFTNAFYETNRIGLVTATGNGIQYTGVVSVATSTNFPAAYKDNMRVVTVSLGWNTGTGNHTRSMSTFFSQMGMQNYIYSQ